MALKTFWKISTHFKQLLTISQNINNVRKARNPLMNKRTVLKTLLATVASTGLFASAAMADDERPFDIEFYLDAYYAVDTDTTLREGEGDASVLLPKRDRGLSAIGFRHNEFNLNTAQMTVSTDKDWYRGRTTLQFGTIPVSSWFGGYLNIQEANLGFKLASDLGAEGNELWVDGGIFLTHIGNELLLPRYNALSTLALVTMFEPFYQSGVKLAYNWGDMLTAELHVMNGYGIIEDNNSAKTVGWLIGYSPLENLGVSWAAVVGDEADAGDPSSVRFYNNFNVNYQALKELAIKAQVDLSTQTATQFYYGAQATVRYDFLWDEVQDFPILGASLRGETIQDPGNMLTGDSLQGYGVTLGLEYKPTSNSFVRAEGRQLWMDPTNNQIFMGANGNTSSNRTEFLLNSGVWF